MRHMERDKDFSENSGESCYFRNTILHISMATSLYMGYRNYKENDEMVKEKFQG